jgi:hypothetical protein
MPGGVGAAGSIPASTRFGGILTTKSIQQTSHDKQERKNAQETYEQSRLPGGKKDRSYSKNLLGAKQSAGDLTNEQLTGNTKAKVAQTTAHHCPKQAKNGVNDVHGVEQPNLEAARPTPGARSRLQSKETTRGSQSTQHGYRVGGCRFNRPTVVSPWPGWTVLAGSYTVERKRQGEP